MTKTKLIFYVDGDNNVGEAFKGIEKLTADDEVHVFYGGKNQYYTKQKKAELSGKSECSFTFTQVDSKPNAADFAIAVEISKHIAEHANDKILYSIISLDQHFNTITAQLLRVFGEKAHIIREFSIENVFAKYFMAKVDTILSFNSFLHDSFEDELAERIYKNMEEIFSEPKEKTYHHIFRPALQRLFRS